MRSLNRPMFKMGGPIKEGVMHGIREPYRSGQLVQPGPGRPGYAGEQPGYFKSVYRAALPIVKSWAQPWKKRGKYVKAGQKLFGKTPPKGGSQLTLPGMGGSGVTGSTTGQTFIKNLKDFSIPGAARMKGWAGKIKDVAVRNPKTSLGAAYFGGLPIAASLPYKKIGSTLVDVAKWPLGFLPGGDDKKTEEVDKVVTEPIVEQFKPKVPTAEELAAIEAANDAKAASDKDKRLTDLLKIMNYDKSRKNAAYDALIDASEVIRETGFKDKSILPIVKATSARFDKPEQIKEAVGLMMAKGEIEKDIYKSKGSASEQQIQSIMKGFGVDREAATAIAYKQPNNISQALLVGISTRGRGTIPTSDTTYSDLYSFLETRNRLDELKGTYNEDDIKDIGGIGKNKTFKTHADVVKDKPDGLYVVEEKVVEVKTGRNPKARVVGG